MSPLANRSMPRPHGSSTCDSQGRFVKRPRQLRMGVVAARQPARRHRCAGRARRPIGIPTRRNAAEPDRRNHRRRFHDEVLFTRLLTDNAGRLLDVTELGRHPSCRLAQAIQIRAGTCRPHLHRTQPTVATLIITNRGRAVDIRHQHGSALPKTPQSKDLRLARYPPRSRRRRLDHARRRTLPMRR